MQDELAGFRVKTAVLVAAICMHKGHMVINSGFADLYRYIDRDIIGNDDIAFLNGILGRGIIKRKLRSIANVDSITRK